MINTSLIESLRLRHGYTQEQIAIMLGYNTQASYSKKIKDSKRFTIEDVVKLCNLFQLTPNDLIQM